MVFPACILRRRERVKKNRNEKKEGEKVRKGEGGGDGRKRKSRREKRIKKREREREKKRHSERTTKRRLKAAQTFDFWQRTRYSIYLRHASRLRPPFRSAVPRFFRRTEKRRCRVEKCKKKKDTPLFQGCANGKRLDRDAGQFRGMYFYASSLRSSSPPERYDETYWLPPGQLFKGGPVAVCFT